MDILMPQLGETVAEGKITTWFKAIGDKVAPGDNLFEIETDKVSMEVPATSAGILAEIRVPAGEVVPVGTVVAVVSGEGAGAPSRAENAASAGSAPPPQAPAAPAGVAMASVAAAPARPAGAPLDPFHPVRTPARNYGAARLAGGRTATPLARRLATEAGIDLSRVSSTGPHGRIIARDVESAIANGAGRAARPLAAPSAERVKALYQPESYQEAPLDAMRRTIADRLVEAKQTIPHFYLTIDVDLDRLEAVREEANAAVAETGRTDRKLSVNDFVIKALARALQRVPAANAVWAHDRILRFTRVDIAVAVATDGGLITPVIRAADTKSLGEISVEMKELAARARERRLKPDEYQGGVATVSNLGMYGIREFSGIINPPQSTLLAVGAGARRPIEAEGGIRFVRQMTVTLSCDHRVVDGALGADLLAAFKGAIEHPVGLMV